jgi:hypothetical protein
MKISAVSRSYKEIIFQDQRIAINDISKSKMISRRQGGGSAGVYENTLRKPTTLPTKIAL